MNNHFEGTIKWATNTGRAKDEKPKYGTTIYTVTFDFKQNRYVVVWSEHTEGVTYTVSDLRTNYDNGNIKIIKRTN